MMFPPGQRPEGRTRRLTVVTAGLLLVVSLSLGGCRASISTVNAKPDRYYGKTLRLSGRIGQILVRSETGETRLFLLVSRRGHRIIVLAPGNTMCHVGDRVRVRGEFTSERTVGGRSYYDVVSATRVQPSGVLRWMPFF